MLLVSLPFYLTVSVRDMGRSMSSGSLACDWAYDTVCWCNCAGDVDCYISYPHSWMNVDQQQRRPVPAILVYPDIFGVTVSLLNCLLHTNGRSPPLHQLCACSYIETFKSAHTSRWSLETTRQAAIQLHDPQRECLVVYIVVFPVYAVRQHTAHL